MKLFITDICDHDIKAMSNCPKHDEYNCGIMYRMP